MRALNKGQSFFCPPWNKNRRVLLCSLVPPNFCCGQCGKREWAAFQNATVHSGWCCICSARLTALVPCRVWDSAAVLWLLSVSRFVFWLIIDLPHNCSVGCCFFVVDCDTSTTSSQTFSHTLTHIECHHSPNTGWQLSTEALTDLANFIVILQSEHLRVSHSRLVWWPSIHLAGLFIVCNSRSTLSFIMPSVKLLKHLHNLRGLMKNKEVCLQIIWVHSLLESSQKFLPL